VAAASPQAPARGVARLAALTTVGTLLLIAMGGAVRATDSGLACPDWPACYGRWIPPADLHMWLEHSHRLWAGVIGLAVLWLTAWTLLRFRDRRELWGLSLAALLLVVVQAGLGAAVVLLQLRAGLVTSHLGMSLVVVGCLIVLAVVAAAERPAAVVAAPVQTRLGRWAAAVAGLVFLQALLGGQATGRGAAYVFNAVPIWLAGDAWSGHVREWLHVTHRVGGYLVAAAVIAFAVVARRARAATPDAPPWTRTLPVAAVALVLVQVGLGLTNVLTRASVPSAIGHLAVASWLWAVLVLAASRGLLRPTGTATGHVPRAAAPTERPTPAPSTVTEEARA
jgi:heme a synthase